MVELRGVCKSFGPTTALRPTDLVVPSGQTTVLLGSSGCGKSTVLRLIIGLIWPDSGAVRLNGESVTPSNAPLLRRRMGYVIQEGGLFPHLTVRDNVALMANQLGWPRARIESRLVELAHLTQLPAEMLDRYPAQISGGQRQRVSLMRALMLDPDLLLLDEPLGALDPIIRADLQTDLCRIFQELKKTVILVTHDVGEAAFLGDRLVLMRDGAIVQQGAFADFVHAPADPFVSRFINAQRSPIENHGGKAS
jgi:osmoprotectant transport system ATP-binding protein